MGTGCEPLESFGMQIRACEGGLCVESFVRISFHDISSTAAAMHALETRVCRLERASATREERHKVIDGSK